MPLQDKTAEKMLNNVADFIAATQAKPDQRAWDQLLVYVPADLLERAIERKRLNRESAAEIRKTASKHEVQITRDYLTQRGQFRK